MSADLMTEANPRDHWEAVYTTTRDEADVSWFQDNPACSLTVPTPTFAEYRLTSHPSRGDQDIVIQLICIGIRIELIP